MIGGKVLNAAQPPPFSPTGYEGRKQTTIIETKKLSRFIGIRMDCGNKAHEMAWALKINRLCRHPRSPVLAHVVSIQVVGAHIEKTGCDWQQNTTRSIA